MSRTIALLLPLLAVACSEAPPPAPPPEPPAPAVPVAPPDAVGRAGKAAKALGGALMGELAAALEEGGPRSAVSVCGEVATRVAAEVSEREGVRVARTSLRLRNPANAPDSWERKVLEGWAAKGKPEPVAEVVEGELRWMKPILVGSTCLPCHGGEGALDPAVAGLLRERYPADAATGFAKGDLRGAFTVTVPLAE